MEIIVIGLNHKTAPLELREKLAFSNAMLADAYSILHNLPFIQEGLVLSTCNRVEIYGVTDTSSRGISELKKFLSTYHKLPLEEFEERLYVYEGRDAVRHLFNVASGLDSMIIGEAQILGQLKKAYRNSQQYKLTGKMLGALFQKSFFTAKRVRSSTNIARGAVSVSSVAVKLAEETLGGFSGKKIIVIGAGKVSESVIKHLRAKAALLLLFGNRTYEKACEIAKRFSGKAIRLNHLSEYLRDADILISSTSAPHFIVKKDIINTVMRARKNKPLILVDLAVPRDIDPDVALIGSVYLYDIDSLKKVADKNICLRRKEIDICDKIIQDYADEFMNADFDGLSGKEMAASIKFREGQNDFLD